MRFRVIRTWYDDGAFGYTAPPVEEVIADWLTRAEAKVIFKHYEKKRYDEYCRVSISVEVMFDGNWENCSDGWIYTGIAEQEDWFDRKGFDYNWWIMFDEIRKVS